MSGWNLYNSEVFWKNCLDKTDVWQGAFRASKDIGSPMYVNCTIIKKCHKLISDDWACFPNAHCMLGFIQYVFLPTFYYSFINNTEDLITPIVSQDKLIMVLKNSGHSRSDDMIRFLNQVQSMWLLCEFRLSGALQVFCREFNESWLDTSRIASIEVFTSEENIYQKIRDNIWCEEVLCEETGMNWTDIRELCNEARKEYAFRVLLVYFLNNKLGCLA